jgi:hypothetical protein
MTERRITSISPINPIIRNKLLTPKKAISHPREPGINSPKEAKTIRIMAWSV